jgi:hypothetical protein
MAKLVFTQQRNRFAKNAKQFNEDLVKLGSLMDLDIETFIRSVVLRVFNFIVLNSPVDTGAYRASHGITTGDPSGGIEGAQGPSTEKGGSAQINGERALKLCEDKINGWSWKIGDGVITIFNNQPYAEMLDFGGYGNGPKTTGGFSSQAPKGIYTLAVASFEQIFQQELKKYKWRSEGV